MTFPETQREKRIRIKQENCTHENSCRDWDCYFDSDESPVFLCLKCGKRYFQIKKYRPILQWHLKDKLLGNEDLI